MTQSSGKNGKESKAPAKPAAKSQGKGCLAAVIVIVLCGLPAVWGMYDEGVFTGHDQKAETAPVFGPEEEGRLVKQLDTAADAQHVCYGWVIDSGRSHEIKKVTPSYPGTFRPQAPSPAPAVQAGAGASGATPAPRPGPTGTGQGAAAPRSKRTPTRTATPTPRETSGSYQQEDIEDDLADLKDGLGIEYGSNLGPDIDPRQAPRRCPEWVVLEADYIYSSSDQYWISGSYDVKTSFDDIGRKYILDSMLGQSGKDDVDGEHAVARLRDAIGALPMWISRRNLAPPVPAQTRQAAAPASDDKLAVSHFTARNVWTGIGIALLVGAVVVIVVGAVRRLRGTSS